MSLLFSHRNFQSSVMGLGNAANKFQGNVLFRVRDGVSIPSADQILSGAPEAARKPKSNLEKALEDVEFSERREKALRKAAKGEESDRLSALVENEENPDAEEGQAAPVSLEDEILEAKKIKYDMVAEGVPDEDERMQLVNEFLEQKHGELAEQKQNQAVVESEALVDKQLREFFEQQDKVEAVEAAHKAVESISNRENLIARSKERVAARVAQAEADEAKKSKESEFGNNLSSFLDSLATSRKGEGLVSPSGETMFSSNKEENPYIAISAQASEKPKESQDISMQEIDKEIERERLHYSGEKYDPELAKASKARIDRGIVRANREIQEALQIERQILLEGEEEGSERLKAIDEFLENKQAEIKALEVERLQEDTLQARVEASTNSKAEKESENTESAPEPKKKGLFARLRESKLGKVLFGVAAAGAVTAALSKDNSNSVAPARDNAPVDTRGMESGSLATNVNFNEPVPFTVEVPTLKATPKTDVPRQAEVQPTPDMESNDVLPPPAAKVAPRVGARRAGAAPTPGVEAGAPEKIRLTTNPYVDSVKFDKNMAGLKSVDLKGRGKMFVDTHSNTVYKDLPHHVIQVSMDEQGNPLEAYIAPKSDGKGGAYEVKTSFSFDKSGNPVASRGEFPKGVFENLAGEARQAYNESLGL